MKPLIVAALASLLWSSVAQAALSPPASWSFIGVGVGYAPDPGCAGQAGCSDFQPQFSFLSGPAQLFPPHSVVADPQGGYHIATSLSPLGEIFGFPQFTPYRLGTGLSGQYTATLSPASPQSQGDQLYFAVATDHGPLRLQQGSGTFHFAAEAGSTYYALAYGAVTAPLNYSLDVAPVPLPGALVLFLSGLGVIGLQRRRS